MPISLAASTVEKVRFLATNAPVNILEYTRDSLTGKHLATDSFFLNKWLHEICRPDGGPPSDPEPNILLLCSYIYEIYEK